MKQLEKFNIDEAASKLMTSEEIELFVTQNSKGFIFQKVIERARHYSDLATYYLEASLICEQIADLGKTKSFKVDWNSGHHPIAQFVIVPEDLESLSELLFEFTRALSGEDEDDAFSWMESLEEYKDEIKKRQLKFPELADDYFANLINGAYGEYESQTDEPEEFRSNIAKDNPEHLFGFWKCMYSDVIQQDFYVSSESWIIPPQSDLKKILKKHSSIARLNLERGNIFSLNGGYYLINENYVLSISFPALAKALHCISHVFNEERSLNDQHNWLYHLNGTYEISISDFAGFVLFSFNGYNIILWNQHKLSFNDINLLNRSAAAIFQITSALIGLKDTIACDWTQLNDETFEELCYDIIYYDPRFDHKTIRKMGKSRSRDGGRDLEVYTQARLGYKPEKYIFQCKLLKPDTSLTPSKVQGISDIVEQYEANGYGIFTSGVIDPTLFDRIDAIAKRKNINTELASKYELERTLALLPKLKERYFN
ncbi:MAG: hypothetical protein JWP69_2183 [Flaviaesturariibacter sp.]|nr:hypothetical protein [Flaviaesturariibacter sp.]